MIAHLWTEIRPAQWAKNLTVLAPLLFAQQLFIPGAFARAVFAFVLFCLLSSAVYLLNDVLDYEQDRLHPEKRRRPLAAGHLTRGTVMGAAGVLLVFAFGGALLLGHSVVLILVGYWVLNLLYSLWLKHQVILDVFALAAGFVLRVVAGAVAVQVEISHWLLICTTLLALFLGFCKRRHELLSLGADAEQHRQVLTDYDPRFLDIRYCHGRDRDELCPVYGQRGNRTEIPHRRAAGDAALCVVRHLSLPVAGLPQGVRGRSDPAAADGYPAPSHSGAMGPSRGDYSVLAIVKRRLRA
jgi:UbiA prenyltransferase family